MNISGDDGHTDLDMLALDQLFRRVVTDSNFQSLTRKLEEIPRLQQLVAARDALIQRRNDDLKTQKAESDVALREIRRVSDEDLYEVKQQVKDLQEEVKKSKDTVAQRNKTIERMKSHEDDAKKRVEELDQGLKMETDRYNGEVEKSKQLDIAISKLGLDFETLENKLEEEKKKTGMLENTKTSLENEKASLATKNQALSKKQQELNNLLEPLREDHLEDSISQFNCLWRDTRQLIESYFRVDLPIQKLHDRSTWSGLHGSEVLEKEEMIPIPQSNSNEAKLMRVAAILAILSRLINRDIFQPTFLLDSKSGLRELLREQATVNSEREAQCRALLLAMFPDDHIEGASEKKQEVACKFMSVVDGFLPREKLELFRSDLDRIIQSAVETWMKIQRMKQKLEPDFVPKQHENARWKYFESYGGPVIGGEGSKANGEGAEANGEDAEANGEGAEANGEGAEANYDPELHDLRLGVVPRLFLVEEHQSRPVTAGLMLKKSQCVAAEREAAQPSSPTSGRFKFSQRRTSHSVPQPIVNGLRDTGK